MGNKDWKPTIFGIIYFISFLFLIMLFSYNPQMDGNEANAGAEEAEEVEEVAEVAEEDESVSYNDIIEEPTVEYIERRALVIVTTVDGMTDVIEITDWEEVNPGTVKYIKKDGSEEYFHGDWTVKHINYSEAIILGASTA